VSRLDRVKRALSENAAETSPQAEDARLRGRTYAVPFEDVWRAALGLADGGRRGWRLISADDETGEIVAEARTLVFGFVDDVTLRIVLDADAQTRIDMRSASRTGRADLGTNARRIADFFRRLDTLVRQPSPRDPLHPAT
jgi:hypothetical protein